MPEFAPDVRAEALRAEYGYDIIAGESLPLLIAAAVAAPRARILEIGTSVGYSALCLAIATGAQVDTIEKDAGKRRVARPTFELRLAQRRHAGVHVESSGHGRRWNDAQAAAEKGRGPYQDRVAVKCAFGSRLCA